tara:strand:- start:2372 stop:2806 length:435 start_codon:yes stop_codon:yes gene_type:complete
MIRGKLKTCPFGLSIPGGCKSAGGLSAKDETSAIFNMVPLEYAKTEEEKGHIREDNLEELLLAEGFEPCPFADLILEDKKSVDCKYDSEQPEIPAGNVGLNGSPAYPHIMVGNMPKPQYGYPISHYSDDNESRNVYYGLYSLIG